MGRRAWDQLSILLHSAAWWRVGKSEWRQKGGRREAEGRIVMGYLISETTREEREQIVKDSLGNIDASCDGCMAGLAEMYQADEKRMWLYVK